MRQILDSERRSARRLLGRKAYEGTSVETNGFAIFSIIP